MKPKTQKKKNVYSRICTLGKYGLSGHESVENCLINYVIYLHYHLMHVIPIYFQSPEYTLNLELSVQF